MIDSIIKIKRISHNKLTNKNKNDFLKDHFEEIKRIKNEISEDIFKYIKKEINNSLNIDLYQFKLSEYRNKKTEFDNHLTSFEFQKITGNIIDHYNNYLKKLIQNKHFGTYNFIPVYYKKSKLINNSVNKSVNKKNNKLINKSQYLYQKGDFKEYKIIENKTILSNLVNYLKFVNINNIINYSFNFNQNIDNNKIKIKQLFNNRNLNNNLNNVNNVKDEIDNNISNNEINNAIDNNISKNNNDNKSKIHDNENKESHINTDKKNKENNIKIRKEIRKEILKIRKYEELNKKLKEIYNKPQLFKQMIQLLKYNQINISKNIRQISYNSGSYIKVPLFNKNSNNPTKHSYVFKDETNSLLNYWYKFKTPIETKYIPLSYNNKYHKNFKNFDLDKETYISFKNNKLNINLNYIDNEEIIYLDNGKTIAIDLNVRDNFLTYFDGLITKEIDYDRKYINNMIKELESYDKLSKGDKELYKDRLDKIVRQNEWYFKLLISNTLKVFQNENVSRIILEDLDLSKTSASYVKNEEFKIKYSRLIRLLRLSNMKEWFKEQSKKYGIQIILTNPAYSSQECNKCHFIHKLNRNKDKFECLSCGHKEHSDYNSPKVLYNRVMGNVSLKLHNIEIINNITWFSPKKLNHKSIKYILEQCYEI
jgi:transposase